jgi:hypothetical protein
MRILSWEEVCCVIIDMLGKTEGMLVKWCLEYKTSMLAVLQQKKANVMCLEKLFVSQKRRCIRNP